jgi:type II secretory pathway pseudopilin PulG
MKTCTHCLGRGREGYTLLIVVFAVTVLTIGLMVAIPVWETQLQREKEDELIFRGLQYVEAIRIYQAENPGKYPQSLEDLIDVEDNEPKYIRKLFPDPMTENGEWNIVLLPMQTGGSQSRNLRNTQGTPGQVQQQAGGRQGSRSPSTVLVASQEAVKSLQNPQIIGVVSPSPASSKKIYFEQDRYDKWLFFYGMDPENMPEVEYLKEEDRDD